MLGADHLHGAGHLTIARTAGKLTPLRLGIVAGELSGDALGASLVRGLADATGQTPELIGVGGPALAGFGLNAVVPFERFDMHGFVEPLLRLPSLLTALRRIERAVLAAGVDAFVGVDFNVFNLLLERRLKRRGVRTVHFVSPSVYAWRRGRIKRLARSADLLLTLFPFEAAFYAGEPLEVAYVGHPMADAMAPSRLDDRRREARRELGLAADARVLALLPGSRRGEVQRLLDPFLAAAGRFADTSGATVQVLIPVPRPDIAPLVRARVAADRARLSVRILDEPARRALAAADLALVKAGTGTLEATLSGVPMVVAYRLDRLSHAIARRLVHAEHFALPNLLAGEALVPEFIQDAVEPAALAAALDLVAADRDRLRARFAALHARLRRDTASSAAAAVMRLVGR
ncbi:MAG: lipid-A-disaccharide synthase [Pseudomonadota bacterium]